MQRAVAAFPRQAPLPSDHDREEESEHLSGFFGDASQTMSQAQLAAAMALAVHRRLIEQPARQRLPLS
jgi:hypothetical protein